MHVQYAICFLYNTFLIEEKYRQNIIRHQLPPFQVSRKLIFPLQRRRKASEYTTTSKNAARSDAHCDIPISLNLRGGSVRNFAPAKIRREFQCRSLPIGMSFVPISRVPARITNPALSSTDVTTRQDISVPRRGRKIEQFKME